MDATSGLTETLSRFNHLVLQYQDDAYTLAWYLLGDEAKANTTTQLAVNAAFPHFLANSTDIGLVILNHIVHLCRGKRAAIETFMGSKADSGCRSLLEAERHALVLIEILNLSYQEAAVVTARPVQEISRLLGQARRKIARR